MKITAELQPWPYKKPFKIAYHTFSDKEQLYLEVEVDGLIGRGEAAGHPHVAPLEEGIAQIQSIDTTGLTPESLQARMPRGPGRNALDCALWDLRCKQENRRIWELLDLPAPKPLTTAYTIGIADEQAMADEAVRMSDFRVLKLKVDGEKGFSLLSLIAEARPDAEFIIDANEGWGDDQLRTFLGQATNFPVRLIEQPLPRDQDGLLATIKPPIPCAADESFHGLEDVAVLANRYQVINIKMDKIGGLTEGVAAARAARELGLGVMIGCNGATSLGIAPAYCIGLMADFVDLDSPLLLASDREHALTYADGKVLPPVLELWG